MHIVRLIGLISPVAAEWVMDNGRVETVLAVRPILGGTLQPTSF
jgi:hypothetical protein